MQPRIEVFDRAKHKRGRFDCGNEPLNAYLRRQLGQDSDRGTTRAYVLTVDDSGEIVGFVTLSACRLTAGLLPDHEGLSPRLAIPSTLIGRLAVDTRFRGKGLGGLLVYHAMAVAVASTEHVASAVIEVDAKDEESRRFWARYGFQSLPDSPDHMYLPMRTARAVVKTSAAEPPSVPKGAPGNEPSAGGPSPV